MRTAQQLPGVTIAFLGIGLMGERQVRVLLKHGFCVNVWNRNSAKAEGLASDGASVAYSPGEAVANAQVVITMLSNGEAVEDVLFTQQLAQYLQPGAVVVDMSSVRVDQARSFARQLGQFGVDFIDAPVSGGTSGAENGTLAIMCGGDENVFARVRPVLSVMGNPVLMGGHGAGQLAKLANQMIVGTTIAVVAEAMALVEKGGADPARLIAALAGGYADSTILRIHGKRMAERDFRVSGRTSTQLKDLNNALRAGRESGSFMPFTAMSAQLFTTNLQHAGDIDHSGILHIFL